MFARFFLSVPLLVFQTVVNTHASPPHIFNQDGFVFGSGPHFSPGNGTALQAGKNCNK